jgi:hypothetical protein
MAHSLQNLFSNFNLYYGKFYNYMLYSLYYGLVPTVIVYGKIQQSKQTNTGVFAKPHSPILIAFWNWLIGKEEADPYGGAPQGQYGGGPGYY